MSKPDFENLLMVLKNEAPNRPTLFEFFLNGRYYEKLSGKKLGVEGKDWKWGEPHPVIIEAFKKAGYDYAICLGADMAFDAGVIEKKETISLNTGNAIRDRESFESYKWPKPDDFDYSRLGEAERLLPDGMKLVVYAPGGVLENVISLMGFDRLCTLLVEDQDLVKDTFDEVGRRLVRYYEICAEYDSVGALISNDDWGFKTGTMLSPGDLRRYVFCWHEEIAATIHSAGKPAILHSCGKLDEVMDDVIDDMKFDAKHSFEDVIMPIEEAYEVWSDRIAILGGIDVDFICRSRPEQIRERCKEMLAKAEKKGGYALGTGNSVPEYVPYENYLAMIDCVLQTRA